MKVAVAHSEDPLARSAALELVAELQAGLGETAPALGMVFASEKMARPEILEVLEDRWPDATWMGCTTDGEGSHRLGLRQDSVVVLVLGGALVAGVGSGRVASLDPAAAGRRAVEEARSSGRARSARGEPVLGLIFPETLRCSATSALRAASDALGEGVPLFGAAPADDQHFEAPLHFVGHELVENAVSVVLLWGDLRVSHGVGSGFEITGHAGRVTRSEGNVVYEIDGEPALAYYREYLGELLQPSNKYPLALAADDDADTASCIRTPIRGDQEEGSITFAADVPEGSVLRFAETRRDDVLAAVEAAVTDARGRLDGEPRLALFFSCAGRRELLGTRAIQEVASLRDQLPEVPVAGFYGYGEIGPLGHGGPSTLHNETFICVLVGTDGEVADGEVADG